MKLRVILLCCAVLICARSVGQIAQDSLLIKGRLNNGLMYYIYPNDNPKGEAIYRLFIKSGSLYEREDQRGLAHFLEHMAFNGSTDFPSGSLIAYLQSKGAGFGSDINAHTSMNETVYKLKLPSTAPTFVDSSLMVLANWAAELTLDSAAIEKERGIILSEWLTRTGPKNDVNSAFLIELLNSSQYTKRLTIGDTAVLKHFSHDKLRSYYRDWYNPKLMAVAVSGDVDPVQVEAYIKRRFSPIYSSKIKVPRHEIKNYTQPDFKCVGNASITKIEFNAIQLTDMPRPVTDEKSYFEYLTRSLINMLMKERFNALTFSATSYLSPAISYSSIVNAKGVLAGSVALKPGKLMSGIRDYAFEAERIYRYGFISHEINKVKKSYTNSLKRKSTSEKPAESSQYIDEMYSDFYRGNLIITPQEEYRLMVKYIDRIDSAMVVKELQKLRKPKQTHYFMTYSDKVSAELPTKEAVLSLFDSLRSAAIEPYVKYVDVPDELLEEKPIAGSIVSKEYIEAIDAYRLKLSNGAIVTFKQSDIDKDRISFGGFRRGGMSVVDSTDYVSAQFAASVIPLSGAGEFSREALNYFLAGSSVSARFIIAKNRSGIIGGSNLAEMPKMFELLYLKWCFPKMDTTVLNQTKKLSIENYTNSLKTETDKFSRDLSLLLGGRDYTTRQLTDTLIREQLDPERLLPIFDMSFGPVKDYEFIFVGDCELSKVEPFIEKYIAALPAGQNKTEYVYGGPRIPATDTTFVRSVGDNPKATVSLFFQNDRPISELRRQNLMGDVVKSIVRTHLLKELREKANKIYSVSVGAGATNIPSSLNRVSVSFSCKPEDVDTLISQTMKTLKELHDDKAAIETTMTDVKLNLIKTWNAERQKNMYWSSGIRNVLYRGDADWSYLIDYDDIINAVTADDVSKYVKDNVFGSNMVKAILLPKQTDKTDK